MGGTVGRFAYLFISILAYSASVHAQQAGEKLFKGHCAACHSLADDGKKKQGPNLAGVLARKAGTNASFTKYSPGLKAAGWQWTPEQLDLWLTDPKALVPDTLMSAYKQKDPEKRKTIIEYIKANGG
jgi:cytochrome c